jgi:hypothetical protein
MPGFDVDNGVMVSGIIGGVEYGLSLTQGYGHHQMPAATAPTLACARVGIVLGDAEEYVLGMSSSWGDTRMEGHHGDAARQAGAGLDATATIGRAIMRAELTVGRQERHHLAAAFGATDYAILPRLDVTVAGSLVTHGTETTGTGYAGLTAKPSWFTIRGGYSYADTNAHTVFIQLYRLFSVVF